jgi:hypothetical protein
VHATFQQNPNTLMCVSHCLICTETSTQKHQKKRGKDQNSRFYTLCRSGGYNLRLIFILWFEYIHWGLPDMYSVLSIPGCRFELRALKYVSFWRFTDSVTKLCLRYYGNHSYIGRKEITFDLVRWRLDFAMDYFWKMQTHYIVF